MTVSKDIYPVLLFDGVCNLCRASVLLVIEYDKKCIFKFSSQQSQAGQELFKKHDVKTTDLSSVILIDEDGVHYKSTAALRTARRMAFPWPLLYGFIVLPEFIRDAAYSFIGKRRYKWFGKMNECWAPDDKVKARFLE